MKFPILILILITIFSVLAHAAGISLLAIPYLLVSIFVFVVNIYLCARVFDDSTIRKERLYLGIDPWVWSIFTLIFGLVGVLFYWILNDCCGRKNPIC